MPPWLQAAWAEIKARNAESLKATGYAMLQVLKGDTDYWQNVHDETIRLREARHARQRVERLQAELAGFLAKTRLDYEAKVQKNRALGDVNYPDLTLEVADFGGEPAVVRYNLNGERGRVDIFYGGNTPNPLQDGNGHGHIIIINDEMESWEEPGPKGSRNRLY